MMVKKRMAMVLSALALTSLLLASCAPAQDASVQDASEQTDAAETTQTATGTATLTWHGTTQFVAAVEVTVTGDTIDSVTVRDGSMVSTDAFTGWIKGQEEYLAQYTGKTLEQIKALEAKAPENPKDHHDGGSMSGDVDAISGATASSTVVAMAVKNAVEKIEGSGA